MDIDVERGVQRYMCGRYFLDALPELMQQQLKIAKAPVWSARYNIAPTQQVLGICLLDEVRTCAQFRWGLVPAWAKDVSIGLKAINARSETVATKPMFRDAFRQRRCLIPASGYYEWSGQAPHKQAFVIRPERAAMFVFAGLWERWRAPDGSVLLSATILTTEANPHLAALHARMPLILGPEGQAEWLGNSNLDPQSLPPADNDGQHYYPVSPAVGNVRNDDARLIAPWTPRSDDLFA